MCVLSNYTFKHINNGADVSYYESFLMYFLIMGDEILVAIGSTENFNVHSYRWKIKGLILS